MMASSYTYASAFATILISHESFGIGSVTHQAPTRKNSTALAIELRAPVPVKARRRLTTSNLH
jgi:hypothetical protein